MDTRSDASAAAARGRHDAIGASPAGSRREALRTLLGGVGGIALAGAVPAITHAAIENNWQLCTKCRGLVWDSGGRPCPAGGSHRLATSTLYALYYGPEPLANHEADWRWCHGCGLLTWQGRGPCPATGNAHTPGTSIYHVEYNQPPEPDEVGGWRYCFKCETLFRPKGRKSGVCPADGRHKSTNSFKYNVYKAP